LAQAPLELQAAAIFRLDPIVLLLEGDAALLAGGRQPAGLTLSQDMRKGEDQAGRMLYGFINVNCRLVPTPVQPLASVTATEIVD
jgi:hypothetical protein